MIPVWQSKALPVAPVKPTGALGPTAYGGKMTVFAERIQAHIDDGKSICEGLSSEGPAIIGRLQDRGVFGKLSLRALAVAAKLSPTYLSKILAGTQVISKGAYLRLIGIEAQWTEHETKQKGGIEAK